MTKVSKMVEELTKELKSAELTISGIIPVMSNNRALQGILELQVKSINHVIAKYNVGVKHVASVPL